uniref:Uncharacterized protein n=1 Tax=viral metagenome TaxID=1070528 RepID=A0A6C0JYC5_9ZZZZ
MAIPLIDIHSETDSNIAGSGNLGMNVSVQYVGQDTYIIDEIAESEEDFLDSEKYPNRYYIGSAMYYPEYNDILLDTSISPATLFSYTLYDITLYLAEYSICNVRSLPAVHILQLDIKPDGRYCTVIKTFWLKIVQRAWKKQFAKRQIIICSRGKIAARRHFELTGTYPRELRNIPGLRGLLV